MTNSAHAQCLFSLPDDTFNDFSYTQLIHNARVAAVRLERLKILKGWKKRTFSLFLHAWVKIFQGHDHFGDESLEDDKRWASTGSATIEATAQQTTWSPASR